MSHKKPWEGEYCPVCGTIRVYGERGNHLIICFHKIRNAWKKIKILMAKIK